MCTNIQLIPCLTNFADKRLCAGCRQSRQLRQGQGSSWLATALNKRCVHMMHVVKLLVVTE
jgi:hypothetical protein